MQWGSVMHTCISELCLHWGRYWLGVWCEAITWTNDDLLSVGPAENSTVKFGLPPNINGIVYIHVHHIGLVWVSQWFAWSDSAIGDWDYYADSVGVKHRTYQTFPMARPKCLMGDFTNLYGIYTVHQTNVWWTKFFAYTVQQRLVTSQPPA